MKNKLCKIYLPLYSYSRLVPLRYRHLHTKPRPSFACKERDPETGLYYYGARYLNPKTARWLSADPALGEYVPVAPLGEEARRRNSNLPGVGGIFNYVNFHVYHYGGNNPVKYVDPDGRDIILLVDPDGAPLSAISDKIPFGDQITAGHTAVIVGNDEDGWLYYSNNGPNGISVGEYSSLEEFRENYNQIKPSFAYSQEQRLPTTREQDKQMKAKAFELSGKTIEDVRNNNNYLTTPHPAGKPYRTATNNCSHHVAAIAEASGQHLVNSIIPRFQVIVSPETKKQMDINRMLRSIIW